MAIRSFADAGADDIAHGKNSKAARRKLPQNLHKIALEKLIVLDAAVSLTDLNIWPSLRLEKLKGDRKNRHSIRLNDQYRICFLWVAPNAFEVEIVDYH